MSLSPIVPSSTIQSDSEGTTASSPLFRPTERENKEPLSEEGKRVTLQEYWDHYYDHEHFNYEWNNGILEAKPMTDYDSLKLYYWFLDLLQEYLRSHPVGNLTGLELGVKMEDSVRKPDTGLVLKSNPIPFQSGDHVYKGVCDLCIESLSTSNSGEIKRDTVTKKKEYAKNGVMEYYILDYRHQETALYQLNPKSKRYNRIPLKKKDIVCSKVLPGFCFRLSDLKKMTKLESLVDDPVYSSYVLLEYQAEKRRTEQEKQRADQQEQRADQQEQRADQQEQRADQQEQRADQQEQRAKQEQEKKEKSEEKNKKLIHFLRNQGFDPKEVLS